MALGSILVRLSMNTADFDTDTKRAANIAEKRAKEIDASFRRAGTAIGLALGAGLIAATAKMKATVNQMDEVSKAAQKVQMPTEEFSRLVYAGELADVQMETLVSSLGKLTKAQAASLKETSQQAKVFDALGISAKNADGSLRASSDVLLDFADVFASLDGSPEAMAAGFALFGRSFQEMIPLIKDGSGAMREMFAESDALGKTLSTEAGRAAEEFNDNLTRLQGGINGVWMEIASGMLPQLNAMTGDMVKAATETDNLRDFGEGLATVLGAIGAAAGFVAKAMQTATIAMASNAEQMSGWIEIAKNTSTLGFADGTVSGGWNKVKNAASTGRGMISELWADAPKKAPPSVIFAGEGPDPEGMFRMSTTEARARKEADALRKRLQEALGGGAAGTRKSGGSKSKAAELTDEQKAAKALNDEYLRTAEGLRERLGLMGLETEAAKMKWETEEWSFKALDPMRKAELIAQAALVDAKKTAMELADDERRANEDAQKSYQAAIEDIQRERDTLGMTNEQLEIYNRLKWAGVDANSAFGKSIVEQSQDLQKARKAMGQQIEAMDAFRQEGSNFLQDLAAGVKPIDALTDALDGLAAKLQQMIADNLMEKFFGQMGSSSTGSSGGGIWDMLGGLFGSFLGGGVGGASASTSGSPAMLSWMQGGYARGGWTGPGGMNEIRGPAHADEVIWSKGDVARAGGVGAVESMRRGGGGRGGVVVNQTITVPANTSYDTAVQAGQLAYAGAGRAARRNG